MTQKTKEIFLNRYIRGAALMLGTLLLLSVSGERREENIDDTYQAKTVIAADVSLHEPPVPTELPAEPEPVLTVGSITLDKYSVSIGIGESDMLQVTMFPENAENKQEIWHSGNTDVAAVDENGMITGIGTGSCTVTVTSADNPQVSAAVSVEVYGTPGLTYIQGVLIVNKTYSLPADYNPGTDEAASAALGEMIEAAKQEGISLWIASAFRSYSRQMSVYNNYAARDGVAAADRYSARPGHSEHQTGLAFDLNSLEQWFGQTDEGLWLAANCWKYGFIIRYPQDKEEITGYMYEPWHVRYIGKETAQKVEESGLCLEEYFNITSVYAE